MIDNAIFYNNGRLNRNKLKETWVRANLPDLYYQIVNFKLVVDIEHFSQRMYHYINDMNDYPKCVYCTNSNERYQSFTTGYSDFCSKKCALAYSRPSIEYKRKCNTIDKYGVAHTSMLNSTKKKQRETNNKLYGGISPACSKDIQLKMRSTNMARYNVEYVMQSKDIKTLYRDNRNKSAIEEITERYNLNVRSYDGDLFTIFCNICNKSYKSQRHMLYQRIERYKVNPCMNCNSINSNSSSYEDELYKYLSIYDITIKKNHRIDNQEIDIYLPDFNIGIEINGLYWHSEIKKNKDYHKNKSDFFSSIGIKILHIWEDDWLLRPDIVKNVIIDKLGIGKVHNISASNCTISTLTSNELNSYIYNNTIEYINGSNISIGLRYNNDLVSVMSFNITNNLNTLALFSDKLTYNIDNSGTTLFNYFIDNYSPNNLVAYIDNDYYRMDSNYLLDLGFVFEKAIEPTYYLCKNQRRFTRDDIINMCDYYKVYNSGILKYNYSF